MENMSKLGKLLCTIVSIILGVLHIILLFAYLYYQIFWRWIVLTHQYLTNFKPWDYLIIEKLSCGWVTTRSMVLWPLKWEIWMNLVNYCVHIVSILLFNCHYVWFFLYLYKYYYLRMNNIDWPISNLLQVLWLSHLKVKLDLKNELTYNLST